MIAKIKEIVLYKLLAPLGFHIMVYRVYKTQVIELNRMWAYNILVRCVVDG